MKDNKGFTLVELIAVVVVLAIIALIAIPAVSGYLYQADDSYYTATESSVLASARDYFSDYHTLLPKNDGDVRELSIQELVDDGYIEEIHNNENQKCEGKVYVKRLGNRDYSYCIVLKCADKVKKNTCTGGEEEESGLKEYAILHKDSIAVPQCTTYQEMLDGVEGKFAGVEDVYKHNNKLVGKIVKRGTTIPLQNNGQDILVYPDESTLNLKAVGLYKLNYEYGGANSEVTSVKVNDEEGPNQEKLMITYTLGSKTGASYSCDDDTCPWVNQKVIIKFEGTDITTLHNCNQPGSGITQFFYKLDGITTGGSTLKTDYRPVTGYKVGNGEYVGYIQIPEGEFNGKVYYNAIDKAGKYAYDIGSEPHRYVKVDIIKPTISIRGLRQDNNAEVASGTWVNSRLKFTFTETSGISGHKEYYCLDNSNNCTPSSSSTLISGNSVSINDEGSYYIRYITISDAGTKSDIHSYNGRVDLKPPTCASSGGGTWTNKSVTITGTCSDTGGSQCVSDVSRTYSGQQHTYNQSPGTVSDHAGNNTACPANQEIKIDTTAPTCNSASSYGSGWTHNDVTVTGTCSGDTGGSGCANPTTVSKTQTTNFDGFIIPGTIYDVAGNGTTCASKQVRIDKTDPYANYVLSGGSAYIKCLDDYSGVASGTTDWVTLTGASTTLSTYCTDYAGNSIYASRTYIYTADPVCGTETFSYTCDCPSNCACYGQRAVSCKNWGDWYNIADALSYADCQSYVGDTINARYRCWGAGSGTYRPQESDCAAYNYESYITGYTCSCGSGCTCYGTRNLFCWH